MDNLFYEKRLVFLSHPQGGPKPKATKKETYESLEKSSLKVEKTPEAIKTEVERTRDSIKTLREHIKKRAERNPALKKILARLDQIDDEFYRLSQSGEQVKLKALQKIQAMIYKPGSELNKQRIAVAKNILEKSVGDFRNGNVARLVDLAFLLKSDGIQLKAQGMSVERRGHNIVLRNGDVTTVFKIALQGDNWSLKELGISDGKRTETALGKDKTKPHSLQGLHGEGEYSRPFYSNRATATKDVYDYSHMPKVQPKQKVAVKKAPEKQQEDIGKRLSTVLKQIQKGESLSAASQKVLAEIAKVMLKAKGNKENPNFIHDKVRFELKNDTHVKIIFPKIRNAGANVISSVVYSIEGNKLLKGAEARAFFKPKPKVATKPKPKVATPKSVPAKPYKFKKGSTGDLVRQASAGPKEVPDAKWKAAFKKSIDAKLQEYASHSAKLELNGMIIKALQEQNPNMPRQKIYAESARRVSVFLSHLKGLRSRLDSQTRSQSEQDVNRAISLLPIGNKKEGPLYALASSLKPAPEVAKTAPKKAVAARPELKFDKVALKDWPDQIQTNVANVLKQLLKYPQITKIFNKKFKATADILMKKEPGSQYLHALAQHKAVRKLFQDLARNSDVKKVLLYKEKALLGQINKLAVAPYPPEPKNPTRAEQVRIAQLKKRRERIKKLTDFKLKKRDIAT